MIPSAEHRGAAQDQAATPPCPPAASQTLEGSFTEPGSAETGYGVLQSSIAVMDTEKAALHMGDVFQRPSTGCRGMPAASSLMPDAGVSQDGSLPGGAVSDSCRKQPQPSEPAPARLACLESQMKSPAPEAHGREAAPSDEGVPVPLMGTLPQAALLTDAGQPEATLPGAESSTSTLRQNTALLQTEEQALSQVSAVTIEDHASATADITASPTAAEQAPMASQNRHAQQHSSADAVRSRVSALPASTGLPQTEQQAPGQDTRKTAENSDKASGDMLYSAVQEAAVATFTVLAAVAQPPPDDQPGRSPAHNGMAQMPLLDSVSGGTGTDDWEHHLTPLQVALFIIREGLRAVTS